MIGLVNIESTQNTEHTLGSGESGTRGDTLCVLGTRGDSHLGFFDLIRLIGLINVAGVRVEGLISAAHSRH